MSGKKLILIILLGALIATMFVMAFNVSSQALGYGSTPVSSPPASAAPADAGGSGSSTAVKVMLIGAPGLALIGAGFYLTRKKKGKAG